MASEEIWIWDAIDSAHFVHRSCISMALGDMLGSAKLNGMAGHTAIFGDHFSMVQAAKSSLIKEVKLQYYPMNPPALQSNTSYSPKLTSEAAQVTPPQMRSTTWSTTSKTLGEEARAIHKTQIRQFYL